MDQRSVSRAPRGECSHVALSSPASTPARWRPGSYNRWQQQMCETYAISSKYTCNIRLKKQMRHLEHTFARYMYSHCEMCNVHLKHLQYSSETPKTLETHTLMSPACDDLHILEWANTAQCSMGARGGWPRRRGGKWHGQPHDVVKHAMSKHGACRHFETVRWGRRRE